MRLLFISSFYLSSDTRYGGAKRLYYFAREWSRRAQLTLINLDVLLEAPEGGAPHRDFGDFLLVPGVKGKGWKERFLAANEDMRPVVERHRERIRAFLAGRSFDAVLLAYPWSLSFLGPGGVLDGVEPAPIYLEDDLSFERYRAEAEASGNPVRRAAKRIRMRQALAFYRPRLERVRKFVGISREEIGIMARHFPSQRGFLATYGLPLAEFPLLSRSGKEPVFGFIGNYGHQPNQEALRWMAEGLADAIRARCPEARFSLAGQGMPAWVREALRARGDVELHGNVGDLRDFYAGVTAFLNPIRSGRGMRTKLVEAAAFGRPIATTSLGAEGLDDLDMRIGDGTQGLADACAALLADPDPEAAIRRNRSAVESRYSLEKVAGDLLAFMEPR